MTKKPIEAATFHKMSLYFLSNQHKLIAICQENRQKQCDNASFEQKYHLN